MMNNNKIFKIKMLEFTQIAFLLGVFFKQFYILPSGSFQVGDAFFMISALMLFGINKGGKVSVKKEDYFLLFFLTSTIVINLVYILIDGRLRNGKFTFQNSIMFYIYILIITLMFCGHIYDENFLIKLRTVFKISMVIQGGLSIINLGRFSYNRYTGSFNDPNQCAFYILCAFLTIYLISKMVDGKNVHVWFLLSLYIIVLTRSIGAMTGMLLFLITYFITRQKEAYSGQGRLYLIIVVIISMSVMLYLIGVIQLPSFILRIGFVQRIFVRYRLFTDGTSSILRHFLEDRCLDRVIDYPYVLLYGSGEGYFIRFPSAKYPTNEIHNSFIAPLFYYGIIPWTAWIVWIKGKLHNLRKDLRCVYIALFVEAFTIVNNRQPFFWMLIILAGHSLCKSSLLEQR